VTFEYSRTVTSSASPAAVWALWSDPGTWPDWDPAVRAVALDGPFAEGTTGRMTLTGGVEAPVLLEVVDDGRRYRDRLTLGDLVIRIDHLVEPADGGSEITVATTIEGPGAEDVGPMVTTDAPTAMARLVELAEG
jgi:hypothetical protein